MLQRLRRNIARHLFGTDPDYQDPYDDPGEQFYARIYLKFLLGAIEQEFRSQRVRILDIGCHTGRLAIPLARARHEVTAIDSSGFHVRLARKRARSLEAPQVRFLKGDAFRKAQDFPPNRFDLVLCTELLYQYADYRDRMKGLLKVVRPGGFLATSHRSRFYYLSQAVVRHDYASAERILNHSEGELWGSYYNWQTPEELKEIYRSLGLELVLVRPIGTFSGNGGEGMGKLCDVGALKEDERQRVLELEGADSEEFAAYGRYILAIGRKPIS